MKNIDLMHSTYALAEGLYTKEDVAEYIVGLPYIYMLVNPDLGHKEYSYNIATGNKLLLLYTSQECTKRFKRPTRLVCYDRSGLIEFVLSTQFCYGGVLFDHMTDAQNTGFAIDRASLIYVLKGGK